MSFETGTRGFFSAALGIALLTGSFARPARGGIVVIDSSRSLRISARIDDPSVANPPAPVDQTVTAGPAARFNQVLQNQVEKDGFGGFAYADQDSTLSLASGVLVFTGTGTSRGSTFPSPSQPGGFASSGSEFSVTFSLDSPATYQLDVTKLTDQISGSTAHVLLEHGSDVLAGLGPRATDGQTAFSGFLAAGTYTLEGAAGGAGEPDAWHTQFVVSFAATAVPEPQAVWAAASCLPLAFLAYARRRWLK